MAKQLFANNAATTLDGDIDAVQTSLAVATGDGDSLFPDIVSAGDFFLSTIEKISTGEFEIVKVTGRAGDTFTIERAQENTTGKQFSTGDKIELRITRDTLVELQNLAIAGGAAELYFDFASPIATWQIVHNLGKYPAVHTYDGTNPATSNEIIGDVKYIDGDTVEVTFSEAVSGRAYVS